MLLNWARQWAWFSKECLCSRKIVKECQTDERVPRSLAKDQSSLDLRTVAKLAQSLIAWVTWVNGWVVMTSDIWIAFVILDSSPRPPTGLQWVMSGQHFSFGSGSYSAQLSCPLASWWLPICVFLFHEALYGSCWMWMQVIFPTTENGKKAWDQK